MKRTNLILGALLLTLGTGCMIGIPTTGEFTGRIVEVRKEGFVCKTYEITVEGMNGSKQGGGVIANPALVVRAEEYSRNGTVVVIKWHREFITSVCRTANGNFVDSITPIESRKVEF